MTEHTDSTAPKTPPESCGSDSRRLLATECASSSAHDACKYAGDKEKFNLKCLAPDQLKKQCPYKGPLIANPTWVVG